MNSVYSPVISGSTLVYGGKVKAADLLCFVIAFLPFCQVTWQSYSIWCLWINASILDRLELT